MEVRPFRQIENVSGNVFGGHCEHFIAGKSDWFHSTPSHALSIAANGSQSVNLASGSYQISFQAAQRANYGGVQSFQVLVDGQVVRTFSD